MGSSTTVDQIKGQAIFLGMLLMLLGMVVGFVFGLAIIRDWGPEGIRAWRVAHTILLTSGLLNLCIGAVLPSLVLRQRRLRLLWWAIVYPSYDMLIVTPLMALTMERGMDPRASVLAALIFVGFLTGSLANFVAIGILTRGAYRKVRGLTVDE